MQKYLAIQLLTEFCGIAVALKQEIAAMNDKEILQMVEEALESSDTSSAAQRLLEAKGIRADALIEYVSVLAQVQAEEDPFEGIPERFSSGKKIRDTD